MRHKLLLIGAVVAMASGTFFSFRLIGIESPSAGLPASGPATASPTTVVEAVPAQPMPSSGPSLTPRDRGRLTVVPSAIPRVLVLPRTPIRIAAPRQKGSVPPAAAAPAAQPVAPLTVRMPRVAPPKPAPIRPRMPAAAPADPQTKTPPMLGTAPQTEASTLEEQLLDDVSASKKPKPAGATPSSTPAREQDGAAPPSGDHDGSRDKPGAKRESNDETKPGKRDERRDEPKAEKDSGARALADDLGGEDKRDHAGGDGRGDKHEKKEKKEKD